MFGKILLDVVTVIKKENQTIWIIGIKFLLNCKLWFIRKLELENRSV